jgi:hypothetical protein
MSQTSGETGITKRIEAVSYSSEGVIVTATRRPVVTPGVEGSKDVWVFATSQVLASNGLPPVPTEGLSAEVVADSDAKCDEIGRTLINLILDQRRASTRLQEQFIDQLRDTAPAAAPAAAPEEPDPDA